MLQRRGFTAGALALGATGPLRAQPAVPTPQRGGTLVIGPGAENTTPLTSAVTVAGLAQTVSAKMFDGLLDFDRQLRPKPQLATHWRVAGRTANCYDR